MGSLAPQATVSSNSRLGSPGVAASRATPHIGREIGVAEAGREGAGVPRIVWNEGEEARGASPAIAIHYQSPHEFLKDLAPGISPERLFLRSERSLPPGSRRPVILHIGFVARELRLNARVETITTPAESRGSGMPPGMNLTLLGPDGGASRNCATSSSSFNRDSPARRLPATRRRRTSGRRKTVSS